MVHMDLRLGEYAELINKNLESYIPEIDIPQKKIYEAVRYSLMAGGKRIRPVITLAVTEMFEGKIEQAIPFACALEMIHTYSLIHDDLPSMDNDDYRRGRLTNHKVFGEGVAVLAGDALLNKAFEIMIQQFADSTITDRKIQAMREIAAASGSEGMIGGQIIDIESEGKRLEEHELRYMHSLKTGRLITVAAIAGAIIGGAGDEDKKRICNYAENLGLAFQIKDDILSEIGNEDKLGKKVGNDRENNKSTYVTIMGLDEAERLLSETTQRAIDSLKPYGKKAEFLINLAEYLLKREN